MAGNLATPTISNLRRDSSNVNRVLVDIAWTPDDTNDNQVDMERFRVRWVRSAQENPPNDAQIQGSDSEVDDVNDNTNGTTGTPGGSTPRTAPNNTWNSATLADTSGTQRAYWYRDEVYERQASDTDSDDDSNTNIVSVTGSGLSTSTRWQGTDPGAGNWAAPSITVELIDTALVTSYVWAYVRCEVD